MRPLGAAVLMALVACRNEPPLSTPRSPPSAGVQRNVVLLTIDTLRADHMGLYGYRRMTSPRMDALGRQAAVFEQAYTYWPKTRGSFVAMLTGRRESQTGYSKNHPRLLEFNPTLASVLRSAGYATAAVVDNGNLASQHGYAHGFDSYRETWQEPALATEMDRTRAITQAAVRYLRQARPGRPFFLWLHYVNPHAPYTPPPPYDSAFLDPAAGGPRLPVVSGFHGGIPRRWAVDGQDRLGYYLAQYDGEIAAVDREVGEVLEALRAAGLWEHTLFVLTSDHGESLGEHGYYFDHGEDLFDPSLRVPLIVRLPGSGSGRRPQVLASTLDLVPTILDAVKVSYPPDLAGASLLPWLGKDGPPRARLYARNDRNLSATWDARLKLVATPRNGGHRFSLFDRAADPGETLDQARARPQELRRHRRELELFLERADREWGQTRRLAGEAPVPAKMTPEACENLRALGYVQECAS